MNSKLATVKETIEFMMKHHPEMMKRKLEVIRKSPTGHPILDCAGTWVGDDIDELLEEVYALRSEIKF